VNILVVNAGSSSLKLSLVGPDDALLLRTEQPIHGDAVGAALAEALSGVHDPVGSVGHRVVHGGPRFTAPARVDDEVRAELEKLVDLAPLHQPAALAGLDAAAEAMPGRPNVACFDTAFHATLPAAARTYPVPADWRDRFGLRRYGFHGLSHGYLAGRVAELVGGAAGSEGADRAAGLRVVSCHLGAGASLAAVYGGRCVDTTMGFTPLDGLMMATRSGSLDPGALLWLQQRSGLGPAELTDALEHRSGFTGLAGTADQHEVQQRATAGDAAARLAMDVYLHRLRAGIAAMAAALGGLDVLAFTGGVGEHSAPVRAGAAAGLAFLGVEVDLEANDRAPAPPDDADGRADPADPDRELTADGARVRTFVIRAREDLQIARETRRLLASLSP
jgi:acetate kinase